MEATLDWRKDSLCVRVTSEILDGLKNRSAVTQWFPLYSAAEEEVRALVGRPLAATSLAEGLYADEDGNVYQLPNKAATRAIDVEWRSLRPERSADQRGARMRRKNNRRGGELKAGKDETGAQSELNGSSPAAIDEIDGGKLQDRLPTENGGFPPPSLLVRPLNLRQKLALVRRRLSYVQKRGYNEAQQYRYVTAADIAGAVGDILAEIVTAATAAGAWASSRSSSGSSPVASSNDCSKAYFRAPVMALYGPLSPWSSPSPAILTVISSAESASIKP